MTKAKSLENSGYAVLFDLDGVLADTETQYTRFWRSIDERYPTGVENFAQVIKGTTLTQILTNFPDEGVRHDIVERLYHFEENMPYELFAGVDKLLSALRRAGMKIAIVTSSDNAKMYRFFTALPEVEDMVDVVINGSMVSRSKPDPEGYLLAAKKLGFDPKRCCVVEDSLQGVEAGRRAGGAVIGVAGTNPRSALEPLSDLTVDRTAELTPDRIAALIDGFSKP